MKKIIVAPVGDYMDDLYVGIKEFPTEKVILITAKDRLKQAEETRDSLEKFKIPTQIVEIKGNVWEETFKEVAKIKKYEKGDILINVSTGTRDSRCAATSAAFINGLKAFAVDGAETMMLPVLKFSYYKMLTDQKMKLLQILFEEKDCCSSLDALSKKAKMSLPLISYHINGTLKSDGLKTMELVETEEIKGRVTVKLSMLGRMLLKGYVQ